MEHTLVAVFDNRTDAQSAMDELLLSGFSREDVRLTTDRTGADPDVSDDTHEESLGATIKHFFADLFGTDSDVRSRKYTTAVTMGHHVLSVTAADEPEVERAADIVERFGPVDIDEKAAEWAGGAPVAGAEAMRMSGAGGMQQGQSFSLQSHGDRHLFQQQSLNQEAPMGTTYQETMDSGPDLAVPPRSRQGTSMQGSMQRDTSMDMGGAVPAQPVNINESQRSGVRVFSRDVDTLVNEPTSARLDDEGYYRSHWDSTYSSTGKKYDEYAPAYSFGHEMANMYRNQPWDDVETDLRSKWDLRNTSGGPSTWEQFKAAIRHGWDRLTG